VAVVVERGIVATIIRNIVGEAAAGAVSRKS
jgi:hypothetical protein